MNFSAVILAGGKSSRMGQDKAWLQADGESLLARQIRVVCEVGANEVFISGHANTDYSSFDCRVLHDQRIEAGPLAGIESALAASSSSLLLVLAVDMPKMQVGLLRQLAARCDEGVGAIPRVEGEIEPLAAFYPRVAVNVIAELFSAPSGSGSRGETSRVWKKSPSATAFAGKCVKCGLAKFVDVAGSETHFFANWNSPKDLE